MEQGILRRSPNIPNTGIPSSTRSVPPLPPKPSVASHIPTSTMTNNYIPYGGSSYGYSSYGSTPYRSSLYSSMGSYGGYGGYNSYGNYGYGMTGYPTYGADDSERRFIQFAEESSRNTFASVENVVRAFSSIAMMLDNTFFAMTSSFRAVLSVAENMGRLRSMFGQIWYSVSLFRFINWAYRKIMQLFGVNVPVGVRQAAWAEARNTINGGSPPAPGSSSWPTLAFFGVLLGAPYFISKLLPKYEDKGNPTSWKSPGVRAKAAFDFVGSSPNELTIHTNDELTLAPVYIQEEMKLLNTGWAFAVCNGKSGVVPLNYLVLMKKVNPNAVNGTTEPIYRSPKDVPRNNVKRVSFGENQIFESTDPPLHEIPIPKVESTTKVEESITGESVSKLSSENIQTKNTDETVTQIEETKACSSSETEDNSKT